MKNILVISILGLCKTSGLAKTTMIVAVCALFILNSHIALAFEPIPTHQNLTKKIIEVYNKNYFPKITQEQLNWMLEGTVKEDTPPRWLNHFYDPVYEIGWTGENQSDIPKDTVLKLSKILLTSQDAVSSLNWLHNFNLQNKYSLYEGDRTYDKAIRAWAYVKSAEKGALIEPPPGMDYAGAFIALGHVLHLLEDLGVPAHARDDSHAEGEPFENWVGQGSNSNLNSLSIGNDKFNCIKIDECFINLAKYTNENFYSEDTIDIDKYKIFTEEKIEHKGSLAIYYRRISENFYPYKIFVDKLGISTLDNSIIHSAYWSLLSKQIVLAGVESLKIFFKDAEVEMVNVQYPRMGTIERTSEQISLGLPKIPGFVSVYGTLAKIGNLASSVWNKTVSGIGGVFASVKNVLADAFGGNNNFQQIGEADINNGSNNNDNGIGKDSNDKHNDVNNSNETNKPNTPVSQAIVAEIVITEIMYNPQGADTGREWLEIFNNDDSSANLTGWKFFENDTNHNLNAVRGSNILKPFEYAVIVDDADKFLKDYPQYQGTIFESSFSLRNDGEIIVIKSGDTKIDEVNYKTALGADGNGNSLQKFMETASWRESAPTPGKPNEFDKLTINKISLLENNASADDSSNNKKDNEATEKTDINLQASQNNFVSCGFTSSQSPSRSQIIINEIAWMGTTNSANDEWIELKNISSQEIDLTNWQLLNKNESIAIDLNKLKNTKIKPGQFLLLERTDDSSASPTADLIYTGALGNTNEGLRLFNGQCVLMDEVLANLDWLAGDNNSKKTIERDLSGFGWHTSASVGGTPKKENSSAAVFNLGGGFSGGSSVSVNEGSLNSGSGGSLEIVSQNNSQNNLPAPQFYAVVINEIMYSPEGADEGREWIEIYNRSTSTVDLTNWKFFENDTNHNLTSASSHSTSSGLTVWNLEPGQYAVISNDDEKFAIDFPDYEGALLQSSFSLNNSGELLAIKNQDLVIDETDYKSDWGADGNGKSLQLIYGSPTSIDGDWKECEPTPGMENQCEEAVVVSQLPVASFSFFPSEPKINEVITFSAASSTDIDGEIVLYEWDFGNVATSSAQGNGLATSTGSAAIYTYSEKGEYEVQLTVYDNEGNFSVATTTITVAANEVSAPAEPIRSVVISEIQAGMEGEADDEFVELYNPTDEAVNLAGWSLKRKTSQTATSTKNLVLNFDEGVEIAAHRFFLIVHESYTGTTTPDQVYTNNSNPLAYDDEAVILENAEEQIVEEIIYQNIESGRSLERKALQSELCVSAQNEGEYLGNACDTDNENDFEIREIPNPQNSQSPAEPRMPPVAPENFTIEYLSNEMSLALSWTAPENEENSSYKITDISDSPNHFSEINSTSTSQKISIKEIGRDYKFSIKSINDIGFESQAVEANVSVSSFLNLVEFLGESLNSSSSQYLIKLGWDSYPFVPVSFVNSAPNDWHAVVFYLNKEAPLITDIFGPNSSVNSDYKNWGLVVPDGLNVKYPNCSGLSNPYTTGSALIMFNEQKYCIGYGNNEQKISYNLYQISGNQIFLPVLSDLPLFETDFIALAFYSYNPRGPYEPSIGLVAVDKGKYYLKSTEIEDSVE